jgi:hypothetical protein
LDYPQETASLLTACHPSRHHTILDSTLLQIILQTDLYQSKKKKEKGKRKKEEKKEKE